MSGIQNHITINFPIKSPADGKAIKEELPPLMPDFAKVQDAIGYVHYSLSCLGRMIHSCSSPTLTAMLKSFIEISRSRRPRYLTLSSNMS
jgi:hypothetical protein